MQKSDYSNEEAAAIQRKFSAAVLRNRQRQRNIVIGVFAVIAAGAVLYFFVVPRDYSNPLLLLCCAVLAIYLLAVTKMYPPLRCPGCQGQLEESFGNYCPECGGSPLKVINGHERQCPTCNRHLRITQNRDTNTIPRNYKIRVCTRCGVTLARTGF